MKYFQTKKSTFLELEVSSWLCIIFHPNEYSDKRDYSTHEGELPVQIGCSASCELSGRVQAHSSGRVHWQRARNHTTFWVFLKPHNENCWTIETIDQNLKEFKFFFHTYAYKWTSTHMDIVLLILGACNLGPQTTCS